LTLLGVRRGEEIMALALLFARLLLAVVFLLAGLAKLADRPGSQKALRDFGVPEALARPMGLVLPIAEIALAALVSPSSVGALGLSQYAPFPFGFRVQVDWVTQEPSSSFLLALPRIL
jgi:DoxX